MALNADIFRHIGFVEHLAGLFLFGMFFMFVPAACIVAVSEIIGVQNRSFFVCAGPTACLAGMGLIVGHAVITSPTGDYLQLSRILDIAMTPVIMALACGIIAGYAYWWLAGRFAGALRSASTAKLGHGEA